MSAAENLGERYLTREQVISKLGFKSPTSLYRLSARHPDFPKPRKTGAHRQSAVRYALSEIDSWMNAHSAND